MIRFLKLNRRFELVSKVGTENRINDQSIDYIVLLSVFMHFMSIIYSRLLKFAIFNKFLDTLLDSTIITIYKQLHSIQNLILFIFYRLKICILNVSQIYFSCAKYNLSSFILKTFFLFKTNIYCCCCYLSSR